MMWLLLRPGRGLPYRLPDCQGRGREGRVHIRYKRAARLRFSVLANADKFMVSSFSHAGEPPTPTKTPTSPNFFLNSFQTPKQGTRFYGPQSPWSPAFHSAASPDLKTPTQLSFTAPTKSPTKISECKRPSTGQDLETEIASHVHHLSPNPSLPLPPVEPSRQLTSSPNPSLTSEAKRRRLNTNESSVTPLKTGFDHSAGTAMNSAGSMQTPPPTSTSASRRKAQQAQVAKLVKESAEKGRRMSFPNVGKGEGAHGSTSQVEESPQQFPALQFSPEGFGYQMSGPATAPVYPQHKLFWDPEPGGDTMNIDFPMDDTFTTFGMGVQKILDPFVSPQDHTNGIQFPTSPGFNLISTRNDNLATYTSTSYAESPSNTVTLARGKFAGNAVNPSLLFSSPGRAADVAAMPVVSQAIQDDLLRPYAHQMRDAQIELDMQLARKPKRKRVPETDDSPAVKAALVTLREDQTGRSGVERDHIDEIIEAKAIARSRSRNLYGHAKERQEAGSRSLQKQRSLSRLRDSQRKRSSVTLTIDASGRAKTVVADDTKHASRSGIPVDNESEDSESDSSSSSAEMVTSQPQSFAFPSQRQKQPKLGRFFNDPKSHSQRSSYTSTLGSASNAQAPSTRRTSSNLHTQHSSHAYNGAGRTEVESEAETIVDTDDDRGDAQSELKKVLQSRSQKVSKQAVRPESRDGFTGQRRAYPAQGGPLHPYYTTGSYTPGQHGHQDPYSNISPTTITDPDMSTPTTGRESNASGDSTRCVCHMTEDFGEVMIQW
ncbi:MAG: hypothetical protein ALECFALPRED_003761 [Alectoria fallacina]|uniref:Uncharacterized protein n=1 Tax=Alectoria fallacina TaxID=1903189 RepID=A0A8H3EP91_9LECA|nr:MAG: hypothetical protein ALECFALPRED_003761 [Alectoria fallacina]